MICLEILIVSLKFLITVEIHKSTRVFMFDCLHTYTSHKYVQLCIYMAYIPAARWLLTTC